LLDLHCERQAVLDLDGHNFSLAKLGDCFEHFDGLLLKPEVLKNRFGTRTVLAANLELPHDPRRGLERGLTSFDPQTFDPAEIQVLEQLNKPTLGFGQRRFTDWLSQLGTPFVEIEGVAGGTRGGKT
jgi:hypothetical protein